MELFLSIWSMYSSLAYRIHVSVAILSPGVRSEQKCKQRKERSGKVIAHWCACDRIEPTSQCSWNKNPSCWLTFCQNSYWILKCSSEWTAWPSARPVAVESSISLLISNAYWDPDITNLTPLALQAKSLSSILQISGLDLEWCAKTNLTVESRIKV